MKRTDLLLAESRGSVQQVMNVAKNAGAQRLPYLQQYFDELWKLCQAHHYDFAILTAQSANETDYWRSNPGWTYYGNPAGIGITGVTGGAAGPNVSLVYKNGTDAARAHIVHMWAYTQGRIPSGHALEQYIPLDPRYEAVFGWHDEVNKEPLADSVTTIDDFNVNGRWAIVATVPWYGDRIIDKGNGIWPGLEQGGSTTAPPIVLPPTPGVGWRAHFNIMFGKSWTITQDWRNDPPGPNYDTLYSYAAGHGTAAEPLNGQQHPGIDVGIPYGTTLRASSRGVVACAGTDKGPGVKGAGCSAFNDWGDSDTTKQGVGRIEIHFPDKKQSLIYGHCRTCVVKAGQTVEAGQPIGTSGGMYGAHCHLEARDFTTDKLLIIDPKVLLNGLDMLSTPTQPPGTETPPPVSTELVFGRVPKPAIIDRIARMANKPEGVGWDNLGKRHPMFIVLHRMIGYLWGTDEYFSDPGVEALTDFGVGVAAYDGPSHAGEILQWTDYFGYRSGWASGRVSAPYGDGKAIVDKYGVNAVNRFGVSVEVAGEYNTPIDDQAWKKIVHLCAWLADGMKVPYHSKIVPETGISLLIWHQEFTIGTGKTCPGDVLMQLTNKLYRDIAAFNQPYQTQAISVPPPVVVTPPTPVEPPSQYAEPIPIPEIAALADIEKDDLSAVVTAEGENFMVVSDWVQVIKTTKRRQRADGNAASIGPDLPVGTELAVRWIFDDGEGRNWYLTDWWTRILVEDTKRLSDTIPSDA